MTHKLDCHHPVDLRHCGAFMDRVPEQTRIIFDIFNAAGQDIFLVGGIVRDMILEKESNDFDFATSAHPQETMQILEGNGLPVYPIGVDFGTIQTMANGEKIEITTFRCKESYTKGDRKPQVVFGQSIEEDLARRDFTINAIAMDRHGNLIDPFQGADDLKRGYLKTPLNPDISFSDDPLRMLRAIRFSARNIAHMTVDVMESIKRNAHLVRTLSGERVFEEMTKILLAPAVGIGLYDMTDTGLIERLFPELHTLVIDRRDQGKYHHLPVWEHTIRVVYHAEKTPAVLWAALFHDVAKPITRTTKKEDVHYYGHAESGATIWEQVAQRLRVGNDFRDHVSQLIYEHQNLRGEMGNKGTRRLVHRLGSRLSNLFALRRADILGHKPNIVDSALADLEQLQRRCEAVQATGEVNVTLPKGTGTKIAQALHMKPGPELGAIMRQLQQDIVDGELDGTSDFIAAAQRIAEESTITVLRSMPGAHVKDPQANAAKVRKAAGEEQ